MKTIILSAAAISLAACSPSGSDPGPGNVTMDEAQALDDAAEMIEDQRLPPEALPGQVQPDVPVELPPAELQPAEPSNRTAPQQD